MCRNTLSALEDKAKELNIDASWLTVGVKQALVRHDEESKTCFEYRFTSREEVAAARADEQIFFKAMWSKIARISKANTWIVMRDNIVRSVLETVLKSFSVDESDLYAFVDMSLFVVAGRTGLAITRKGIVAVNGSGVAEKIADSAIGKLILFGKAREALENRRPQRQSLNWTDLLTREDVLTAKDDALEVGGNFRFECGRDKARVLCDLFGTLRSWASQLTCDVMKDPDAFPTSAEIQMELKQTPWPEKISAHAPFLVHNESIDYPVAEIVPTLPTTDDDYSLIRNSSRIVAELQGEDSVMISPNIDDEKLEAFVNSVKKSFLTKKEDVYCLEDTSFWKNGKKGVAITRNAVVEFDDDNVTVVPLGNIVNVNGYAKHFCVETYEVFCGPDAGIDRRRITFNSSGSKTFTNVIRRYLGLD